MKIELTNSQRMAICTLLAEYERGSDPIVEFTDCSENPPVTINLEELLPLFMGPRSPVVWNDTPLNRARATGRHEAIDAESKPEIAPTLLGMMGDCNHLARVRMNAGVWEVVTIVADRISVESEIQKGSKEHGDPQAAASEAEAPKDQPGPENV